jgi:hypothetical protein
VQIWVPCKWLQWTEVLLQPETSTQELLQVRDAIMFTVQKFPFEFEHLIRKALPHEEIMGTYSHAQQELAQRLLTHTDRNLLRRVYMGRSLPITSVIAEELQKQELHESAVLMQIFERLAKALLESKLLSGALKVEFLLSSIAPNVFMLPQHTTATLYDGCAGLQANVHGPFPSSPGSISMATAHDVALYGCISNVLRVS